MAVHDRLTTAPGLAPGPGFAHAVTVSGRVAFVSGQVSVDAEGRVVGAGDLAAQTRQALTNMYAVLRELGADWSDVAKLGWYLLDVTQVQTIRDVRDELIRPALGELPNPASTLVQVPALVRPEFLVEVDAVVALPS
ncbi:RidA family protein [Planosporangium flavigriseum]|uniref:Enamine deaminase RidA n=1 Tax=Planosporangium flavigriseum TaxID=373681 RepID=A0A8J3LJ15_9ACTN|nr:RidA family protein [Planosporangium flavigriseum]NJC66422.1 RidA family protein [Planosporangium flavigriseum]GIG74168.1 enamine deaminase RidA [Planosporangium flavigriseum]